jgi:glutamate formiminotransferase
VNWVKIVPNISEGVQKKSIEEILTTLVAENSYVIDLDSDPSHNRSVITIICNLENFFDTALNFVEKCIRLINLNTHRGVHPRIGAVDVFPFVNFYNLKEEIIENFATELARHLWEYFKLPTYFYGKLLKNKPQRKLATFRNLGLEKLTQFVEEKNQEYLPDVGDAIHKTAGAICIGLREELIAYNIYLDTDDVRIAKSIASKIRESSGGLMSVQALGFFIEHINKVQVSINLTNYRNTSIKKVYSAVYNLAKENNVEILMSELVGLVPYDAIKDIDHREIKLKNFSESQIFEYHLNKLGIYP